MLIILPSGGMESWEVFAVVQIRFVDLKPFIKLQPMARALSIVQ